MTLHADSLTHPGSNWRYRVCQSIASLTPEERVAALAFTRDIGCPHTFQACARVAADVVACVAVRRR